MKRIFTLLLLFLLELNLYSQSKKNAPWFTCYLPNGLKCPNLKPSDNTIEKISLHFEPKARTWNASTELDESILIVFKSFTKKPLFILSIDKKPYSSERIKDFINSVNEENNQYNYYFGSHKYGHHWGIKANIKTFIKEKKLDEEFLLSTLGKPAEIKESLFDGKPAKYYLYLIEGVRVYFVDGLAVGMDEL